MRVLYDVSVFGTVQSMPDRPSMRAGIHRTVEQLATELLATAGCDVRLCATELWPTTLEYLESHPVFRPSMMSVGARKLASERLRQRVRRERERGVHPASVFPLRVARRAMVEVNRLADAWTGLQDVSFGRGELASADVYHSALYPLPEPVRRRRGLRRFVTIYDVIPLLRPELFSWGGDRMIRGVLASVGPEDTILTISHATKQDLLQVHPIAPERVVVTHLAADSHRFHPCDDRERITAVLRRYGIPDAPYVLSVGTLEPRKNVVHLIRSFAELVRAERIPDLHLVLTGGQGWDYEPIFAEAERLREVRDRIHFTGYADDVDLAPLYSGALAFVYPSLYEGFGLPVLEAMQCGTPVITSSTSSLPEVVGDAGLLVDPQDGAALCQAMLALYEDADRRAELSSRAVARAGRFSWERCAHETVAAYRQAI